MRLIKKLIPNRLLEQLRPVYHGFVAKAAAVYFGRPSRRLTIIGVTGTNGKSTTVNLIAKILEQAGKRVGFSSTVTVNIDGQEKLNKVKMTMPSGWVLNKWLKTMADRGCDYAVLEVSSEGLAQNRHLGINFDVAVFTNLTPEHLEAHGGFENYKQAKAKLFQELGIRNKELGGKKVQKIIITNSDDEHSLYYASFKADKYFSYGVKNSADFKASEVQYFPEGVSFNLGSLIFKLKLKGQFEVYNALAAIAVGVCQNISLEVCRAALEKVTVVPGRVEVIQQTPFAVVVDYAYEPEEMRQVYETVKRWPHKRVLQVLGPSGGGRDSARIPTLGRMAGEFADLVFITTDDPYDDDIEKINREMAQGAIQAGKTEGQNLFVITDRRAAMARALSLAQENDLVLITGKGADQKMALAGGNYIDWDDRAVAKEELNKVPNNK